MPHTPSSPLSVEPPLSLDPREPPVSPRVGSRTPTRGHTPISSRAGSPTSASRQLHLPTSSLNPSFHHHHYSSGSIPSSPTISSRHVSRGREEDDASSIFERDIEIPLELGPAAHLPSPSPHPSSGGAGSASPLLATAISHSTSLHHFASPTKNSSSTASPSSAATAGHNLHHPHARASATDQVFPTVLDDAIEALSSSTSDVFVVSPSRSGSPSGRSVRRSFGAGETLFSGPGEGPGGMSSGQRSPVTSLTGSGVEGRERRSSTVSWTGQAGRMLDASDAHGFRLTLPGEDHPTLISTSTPNSTHSSPPLVSASPSSPFQSPFTTSSASSNSAINPNAHRLSFISPQDLIVSPPLSTLSLSSITSGASLPTTSSGGSNSGSAVQSPAVAPASEATGSPPVSEGGKAGGDEWEREGLGKGLEERLDNLLREGKAEGR